MIFPHTTVRSLRMLDPTVGLARVFIPGTLTLTSSLNGGQGVAGRQTAYEGF